MKPSFRDKLLKYGTCFTIFIIPLLYFGNMFSYYASSKTFLFYGFVEIIGALWVYSLVVDRSYHLTKKQLLFFIPFILYITWLTISGILAVNPALSFWSSISRGTGLLTLYHALVLSLIVSSLVKRDGLIYLHKLLNWLLNSGFILAISVWFGNEGFKFFLNDSQGGGLIGNSSMAAAYFLFVIALGLFLIFSKSIKKSRKWWIGIILATIIFSPIFVNIYGFLTGHSLLGSARGATLGIFVIVGVALLSYLTLSKNKILKILGIAGVLISIICFSIGWSQLMKPGTYIHEKFSQAASNGTRFIFWDSAEKGIDEHPYFGYGIENYPKAFQEFFNPKILDDKYGYESWPDHAHNIYFDTGVAGGYPAIFFYSLFLLSILYGIYKSYKSDSVSRIQASILFGLIIGYVFQNLFIFDSLLSIVALFVLAGIIFALPINYIKEKNTKTMVGSGLKNVTALVLFLLCFPLLIFFVYLPIRKSIKYHTLISMTLDARPDYYNELLKGSHVGEQSDISNVASVIYKYYATNLAQIKSDKNLAPYVDKDLNSLIALLEVIMKRNTNDSRLYISAVSLRNTEVVLVEKPYDPVLAQHLFDILDRAEKLSPDNPEIYWARSNIYTLKGDMKEAENAYKQAIALDPTAPASYRLLLNFAKVTNNTKLYNETLSKTKENIPDFVFN